MIISVLLLLGLKVSLGQYRYCCGWGDLWGSISNLHRYNHIIQFKVMLILVLFW